MSKEAITDVQRHAGQEVPTAPIPAPITGDTFDMDENVVKGKHSEYLEKPDE